MENTIKKRNIISDKLVIEKTGRSINDWFNILDNAGAKSLSHIDIFYLISSMDGLKELGQWNQNLLTTTYEWDRGLKERGQKEDGFEISVSKTVNVDLSTLYNALINNEFRLLWLGNEAITFRKTTENKSARVTWSDNLTSLSIDFYSKGTDKSQIVVQHQKIPDYEMSIQLKEFWIEKLGLLKEILEK